MPTYEYRCEKCGATFERFQSMSEDPNKECLKCGAMAAKRMISQGNFILKGGGWYGDLYAGDSNKKGGSSSLSSSGSSDSKASSSSSSSGSSDSSSSSSASSSASASASSSSGSSSSGSSSGGSSGSSST